ncbi:CoA-acylating methylmalonate-semialdehyde dehydrogenase [Paeniglutamicibacter sp. Y32M11]|uniref:CoA-acylating methylmalonate-semialdehyde dehydrogenase n=1 Tax=Paeniglutamicibacter sp. Y32M11 TaxID=2853258 RepID=UPI001C52B767|nr:CoA-acylating methylmalonate-semialdehyde dehydrogenase [Paeniglutamicibacter sp. Y32M11]QXQ10854.1 CoA-acylating methylmalonate-semialdehyde dehydrogenase [Paeniglutamicibacter sp. Y32M11]
MSTTTQATSVTTIQHVINGLETSGEGTTTQPVYNPATGEITANLALASAADVEATVAAARTAADSWGDTSIAKRTAVLFKFRELLAANTDALAHIVTAEHGKVLSDAAGEIGRGLEVVEYACGISQSLKGEYSDQVSTGIDVFSFRQPLGVVAGITPFNFPVMVPLWMAPVAIAAGNAFILKPSERDPSAAVFMARLFKEAGLPDGVFQVLHGGKETVDGLLHHPLIDGISFVGSTPIAKYVHETATANGKRVQALGGAKNHAVIMPDADMELAADHLTAAAFGSAGQRCMAISVAVAVGTAADVLVDKLVARAKDIKVSHGLDAEADMGPVITPVSRTRVEKIVGEAAEAGAAIIVDGRDLVVKDHENGFFVGPTIIDKVNTEMSAYTEEIFGPVLAIVRVATLAEAIEVVNANPYGNGTAIFTSNGADARTYTRRVHVGMVGVNIPLPVPVAWHSFGGWKNSLFGEHHIYGADGVRFYTRGKAVTQRWPEHKEESNASFAFPSN